MPQRLQLTSNVKINVLPVIKASRNDMYDGARNRDILDRTPEKWYSVFRVIPPPLSFGVIMVQPFSTLQFWWACCVTSMLEYHVKQRYTYLSRYPTGWDMSGAV